MPSLRTLTFTLALFFLSSGAVFAHTLYLKDGRVIKGRILAQTRTEIRIEVNGAPLTFKKTEIRQVDFEQQPTGPVAKPIEKKPQKPAENKPENAPWGLNRWTVAGRSALLPGWGQWAVGERWTAVGALTTTLGAVGYVFTRRQAAISARANYQTKNGLIWAATPGFSSDPGTGLLENMLINNSTYNSYQSRVASYNNSLRILGVVYVAQLAHAYFAGRAYESTHQGTMLLPLPDGDRMQALGVFHYWTF